MRFLVLLNAVMIGELQVPSEKAAGIKPFCHKIAMMAWRRCGFPLFGSNAQLIMIVPIDEQADYLNQKLGVFDWLQGITIAEEMSGLPAGPATGYLSDLEIKTDEEMSLPADFDEPNGPIVICEEIVTSRAIVLYDNKSIFN